MSGVLALPCSPLLLTIHICQEMGLLPLQPEWPLIVGLAVTQQPLHEKVELIK